MFWILSSCLDNLDIKIHSHLLRFPFVLWNKWWCFALAQTTYQAATCSSIHFSDGIGGRSPDIVTLCMIMTKF